MATRFAFLKVQGHVHERDPEARSVKQHDTPWLVNLDQVMAIADTGDGRALVHMVENVALDVEGSVEAFNAVIGAIGRES